MSSCLLREQTLYSSWPSVLVVLAIAVDLRGADQGSVIEHGDIVPFLESPAGDAFLDRFTVAFDRRSGELFADRFHPFNVMNWTIELAEGDHEHLRERASSTGRNAFTKSIVDGAREAAVDLPLMLWLKDRQGFLAEFLRNSVDSVGEESVAPLDVSYRPGERLWWNELSDNGDMRYGIRPFRTSPYAFVSWGLRNEDGTFLLGHVRYYYDRLADHRFEFAMSLPLANRCSLDFGTSYQFGRHDDQGRLTIKFSKEFKSGGIVHVGLEARDHPAFFAGITLPW
jgi:hypothetical protein